MNDESIEDTLADVLIVSKPDPHPHQIAAALVPTVRKLIADELRATAREDNIATHKLTPIEVLTFRVVPLIALHNRAEAIDPTVSKETS